MNVQMQQEFLNSIAMTFVQAQQPLAAAIIFADVASEGSVDPQVWCGLGSCLMNCRGLFVRKPFEEWAGQVFTRGNRFMQGTPYEQAAKKWMQELQKLGYASFLPITDEQFPALLRFLLVTDQVFPEAVAALSEEDAMGAVMALGNRQKEFYLPLLIQAISGKFGLGAGRSALKRIVPFAHRPEIKQALQLAAQAPIAEEYQPYLTFAMNAAFSSKTP